MRTFSTLDVVALTDASYREVDYWLRVGVLSTVDGRDMPGSGQSRRFDLNEVRVVAIVKALRELGCPLETLRRVAAQIREMPTLAGLLFVGQDGEIRTEPVGSGWLLDASDFDFDLQPA